MMPAVMIVDDDADIRTALRDLLEDAGYSVLTARNGADAIAQLAEIEASGAREARPRVVVVDLLMPVMDGVELIARMREQPRFADLPVIVSSASSVVLPPPGVAILKKPFRAEKFLQIVQVYCGG
jgi:CheY-like chemotaxis protein